VRRAPQWAYWCAVVVAWLVAVFWLGSIDDGGDLPALLALGVSVLAGCLIGRWPLLIVPAALATLVLALARGSSWPWVLVALVYIALADAAFAAGIALRRLISDVR
jgi:hypothetical protein